MASRRSAPHDIRIWLHGVLLLHWLSHHSHAFCPQGFGNEGGFPEEWQIPKWPDMDLSDAERLHTVTLGGFKMQSINEEYLEGPNSDFLMQGRETYWQASGKYFMFYCERFDKWRIAEISAFAKNMEGNCFAFVSDAYPGRDIKNKSLNKGFIEVEDGKWVVRSDAGVIEVGKLADQLAAQEEVEVPEGSDCNTADGEESEDELFKKDKSDCPVMPHVRKAARKVVKVAKKASNWLKRLFPKHLGAPDEEDAIPDGDGSTEAAVFEATCQPDTQDGCNFKEKFYVEKQRKATAAQRVEELERLAKMADVVMKPEQTHWLKARLHILSHMIEKDKSEL